MKKTVSLIICVVMIGALMSCANAPRQQRSAGTGAAVGAGIGALLGQALGRDTESTLIGAGIGAVLGGIAGNQVGTYMDRQEADLRYALDRAEAADQRAAAAENAVVQRTNDVLTATFRSEVFFDFDSATLKPGGIAEINRVAGVLNRYPETAIRVEGHTDSTGTEAYNMGLSERRANAVRNALIQAEVNPNRVVAYGYGESQPISSNDATNRRVNVVIVPIVKG